MKKLLLLIIIPLSFLSCGKSGDSVPSVPVNFSLPLSDPRLSALNVRGGYAVFNGVGVAGLILYRAVDGSYLAYDRCSSYMPQKKCAVTVDDSGFTATDPCSGSKFSLNDGTPVKAPATRALRQYSVQVANFQLSVYN